jgi:glycerophosphoryl diester phosphodiesterase
VRRIAALAPALALLAASSPALGAKPVIQAHRGGSFVAGKATYAENTLPAFTGSAKRGFVLEMDTRVVQDGVVVLHDDTVDRTTGCSGRAADMTLAALAACPSDILGSPGSALGSKVQEDGASIPTLDRVLALAKERGARVSVELNDFDPDGVKPGKVLDVIAAAGLKPSRVIVQSFYGANLVLARQRLPGVALSALTLKLGNSGGVATARSAKAKWVSPEWPITKDYVRAAHRAKRKVAAYTLDRKADVVRAAKIGVDAIITDDPVMARRALR